MRGGDVRHALRTGSGRQDAVRGKRRAYGGCQGHDIRTITEWRRGLAPARAVVSTAEQPALAGASEHKAGMDGVKRNRVRLPAAAPMSPVRFQLAPPFVARKIWPS